MHRSATVLVGTNGDLRNERAADAAGTCRSAGGRRRRAAGRSDSAALAEARQLLSRLEFALDRGGIGEAARQEAERCRLLADAALAGRPDAADAARSRSWALTGLAALGEQV